MVKFVFLALQLAYYADAQSYILPGNMGAGADCFSRFPHLRNRFSWEQLEFFCQQKRRFDEIINNSTVQPFSSSQQEYLSSLAIDYPNATPPESIPTRKEIRRMTDIERRNLESAMRSLKIETIDGVSKYDLIVMQHHPAMAPGAHVGAAFLPWHREYLRRFETALRQMSPNVALPYWDSTLDEALIDPRDSILWTGIFFGNTQGPVVEGPYRNWGFRPDNQSELIRLERNAGQNGSLITSELRDFILSRRTYQEMTSCTDLTVETTSRNLHEWVGDAMGSIYYAPQDPIFFYHHVYMDYLWAIYRMNQTFEQRTADYPNNLKACTNYHYAQSEMKPFGPMKNVDGMGAWYGDYTAYEYSPECLTSSEECGSKYLFCHPELKKCVSKIRPGGNCMTFPSEACYDGFCSSGMCELAIGEDPPSDGNDVSRVTRAIDGGRKADESLDDTLDSMLFGGSDIADEPNDTIANITHHPNSSRDALGGAATIFNNNVRAPNTDPFKGSIVATNENRQKSVEDTNPGQGRPHVTKKPRPKHARQQNITRSASSEEN